MIELFSSLEYQTDPFPLFHGSLPDEFYQRVNQGWPAMSVSDQDGRANAPVIDGMVVDSIHALMRQCHKFFSQVIPPISSDPAHIRVQYSQNASSLHRPVPIRGWHLDNGNKYVVGLWYFGSGESAGGDLVLLNPETGSRRVIEYGPNRMVIFPNTIWAWHGITDRQYSPVSRRFLNIVLEDQVTQVKMHEYGPDSNIDARITVETLDDQAAIERFQLLKRYPWLGQGQDYVSHIDKIST